MKKINLHLIEGISGGDANWGEFAEGFCAGFGLVAVGIWGASGFSSLATNVLGGSCGIGAG